MVRPVTPVKRVAFAKPGQRKLSAQLYVTSTTRGRVAATAVDAHVASSDDANTSTSIRRSERTPRTIAYSLVRARRDSCFGSRPA